MPSLDLETLRLALRTAREHGFAQVRIKDDGADFRAVLDSEAIPATTLELHSVAVAAMETPAPPVQRVVESPTVGYFRGAGLEVGHTFEPGDVLGQVEAMGIMNEIVADTAGTIESVLVESDEPVEFGQAIFALGASE